MATNIFLQDGYNSDKVECLPDPVEENGNTLKLIAVNPPGIKWCSRKDWEEAMYNAFVIEAQELGIERDLAEGAAREQREANWREWIENDGQ